MPIIFIVSTFYYTLSPFPLFFLHFSCASNHLLLFILSIPPSPSSSFAWTFPMCQFICCFVYLCSMSFCHGLSCQIASIWGVNFCFFTIVSIVVFFTIIYIIDFFACSILSSMLLFLLSLSSLPIFLSCLTSLFSSLS
jgi:hypothetical protein